MALFHSQFGEFLESFVSSFGAKCFQTYAIKSDRNNQITVPQKFAIFPNTLHQAIHVYRLTLF